VAAPRLPTATRCVPLASLLPLRVCVRVRRGLRGFGAVLVSDADGRLPPFRVSSGWPVACLWSSHGLSVKDALLHCAIVLEGVAASTTIIRSRVGPWLDCVVGDGP
jgi:hypothetical protein